MNRLKEAEAIHARLLQDINEVNRKYLAEFEEKVKARKVRMGTFALNSNRSLDKLCSPQLHNLGVQLA